MHETNKQIARDLRIKGRRLIVAAGVFAIIGLVPLSCVGRHKYGDGASYQVTTYRRSQVIRSETKTGSQLNRKEDIAAILLGGIFLLGTATVIFRSVRTFRLATRAEQATEEWGTLTRGDCTYVGPLSAWGDLPSRMVPNGKGGYFILRESQEQKEE